MSSSYVAAPSGVPSFPTSTDLGSTQIDLAGGLDLIKAGTAPLRAEGSGSFSSIYSNYGGGLSIVIPF